MEISINKKSKLISVESINKSELVKKEFSFLNLLLSEEKVYFDENLIIPFNTFFQLSKHERLILGFLPEAPFLVSLSTNGALLLPNFKIEYAFKKNGQRIYDIEISDYIYLKHDGVIYTMPTNLARVVDLIDEHSTLNGITDKIRKSEAFKELLTQLPSELKSSDDRLKTVQISYADTFTLAIDEKEGQIHPTLLCGESETVLLNSELNQKFKSEFLKGRAVQSHYHLGHNKFVFIPERLKKTLMIVREVQKGPIERRLAFFYNPGTIIEESLEKEEIEGSDTELFIETEHYISERILKLGVWNPKNYSFEPGTKNEWLPTNTIVIPEGDKFRFIKEGDIQDIDKKVKAAQKAGHDHIIYEGEEIKLTPDFIEGIGKRAKINPLPIERNPNGENDGIDKPKQLVPIIKDNIEGEFYASDLKPSIDLVASDPSHLLEFNLYPHQSICLGWLQKSFIEGRRGALLADDMGLGKTFQTLAFLKWLQEEMKAKRESGGPFLVVGPTALLKNWEKEHNDTLKGEGLGDLVEAYGPRLASLKRLGSEKAVERLKECSWALTTYTSMKNNQALFRRVPWKVLIFDEIQAIKNPNAFVTEMAKAIASDFTIGLTGTPVENSLLDLWCISDAVWTGILGLYKDFKNLYQGKEPNLEELKNRLTVNHPPPFMLRRLKEDEIEGLPCKTEVVVKEAMGKNQENSYDEIIKKAQNGGFTDNPFEVVHRLRRISLGVWSDGMSDEEIINSSARLKAALSILDEIKERGEKALIFVESREFQQILIPLLSKRYGLDEPPMLINGQTPTSTRQKYVDNFQVSRDGFNLMLISPKAGGTGFTLTAANNVIHLERMWNPAIEDQCSDRVYRIKQEKNVKIYIPQAVHKGIDKSSFDIILHEMLTRKRELSRKVIVPTGLIAEDKMDFIRKAANISADSVAFQKDFYKSKEWKDLSRRFKAEHRLECNNPRCDAAHPRVAVKEFHADHIKPRSKYPELALSYDNLQILCAECNLKKGNKLDF